MKIKQVIMAFAASVFLSSCTMYYIPVDSFKRQFANLDTNNLRRVVTRDPWGIKSFYKTYPIDSVFVVDKNGNNMVLKNSPALEIRFTDKQDKKTVFYFDRILVRNDTVIGGRSRVLPSLKKAIPLSEVKTIEIQDGGKKYTYVN